MNLNKVFVIGNLTRDPELKTMPNGNAVCNFSLAVNRVWYNSEKVKQQEVEFINIVVFGKMGENVAQYMKKGSSLMIEGRIKTRSWEGQDGKKVYRTEIIAEAVQFGAKAQGGESRSSQTDSQDDAPDIDSANIPF